jgi:outer membrane protein TolC
MLVAQVDSSECDAKEGGETKMKRIEETKAVQMTVGSRGAVHRGLGAGAERLMASANAQIGVAEAAYYPNVSMNTTGGFESSSAAKWFSWMGRFWSAGLSMTQTLFDGGLRGAQVDQARAAYDASVASYRQTVLTGYQEVEDNLAAQRILRDEARTQDEAVKAAQQSLAVTMNQYQAGIVSYLNVIVAQTIALSNQNTAVNILGRRLNASVLLVKALGGGWKTP